MRSWIGIWLLFATGITASAGDPPSGDSIIRGQFQDSEIVITTTSRLAGAIHSITWNGQEYIDSVDHGRQLQSACSFDCARTGKKFWAEAYNPTEAGSRRDGAGEKSTSKLLEISAKANQLRTKTQMAFWLNPGEKSAIYPALNTKQLSDVVLTKKVTIGYQRWPNVLDYHVSFTIPKTEKHTLAQLEVLTGYMPAAFSEFLTVNLKDGTTNQLSDGPGEQSLPVLLATKNGDHAMAAWTPTQPTKGQAPIGYGRFRFAPQKVVKWNVVQRIRHPEVVPSGDYRFRVFVAVGSKAEVAKTLAELSQAEHRSSPFEK